MTESDPAGGTAPPRPPPLAALRHRHFTIYAFARLCATLAWQMLAVAVGWQVYEITRNPLHLGYVGLAQFLPFVLLVLPAGQLADRIDRRLVLVGAYAVDAVAAALLLWFSVSGMREVWPVFAAMVLFGAGRAFWMPTGQAMTPNLVPPEAFPSAVAINSTLFEIAVVAGPALGGFVLYLTGPSVVYGTAFALLVLVVLLMITVRPARAQRGSGSSRLSDALEGLRFVMRRRTVLGAISLDLFAVLFGGVTAVLPIYASDVLHVGPAGLGALRTAPAVGAALMAAVLAVFPITRHVGRWMFGGVAVYGVATIVFGVSGIFWLSLLALFAVGAGDMVSVYVRHLLVQLETPDSIRGRVSAVSAMFIGASNELGEFESGVAARWLGLVPSVVLGGLATLGVVAAYMRRFPELRTMDRFPKGDGHASG
ncbi:MAG: MFS transporter [Pseudomonadota bacterium]|jgi:Arabinose efflux permease|nr:MAG: MFS transporter [Pseudomonadota bacterium]